MEKIIEDQIEIMSKTFFSDANRVFSLQEFEKVLESLNKVADEVNFEGRIPKLHYGKHKHMFRHNGFKNKYCNLYCHGCRYEILLSFNFKGGRDTETEPFDIELWRPVHGMTIHTDVEGHLAKLTPINEQTDTP